MPSIHIIREEEKIWAAKRLMKSLSKNIVSSNRSTLPKNNIYPVGNTTSYYL
jgi:hypothetical protein